MTTIEVAMASRSKWWLQHPLWIIPVIEREPEKISPLRSALERQWSKPGIAEGANLCIWRYAESKEGLVSLAHEPGTPRDISRGANAWLLKVRKFWGPPPPGPYNPRGPLKVPEWLRERYKKNCPRNYSELVKRYGTTDVFTQVGDRLIRPRERA